MFGNGKAVLEMPADASGSAGGGTQSYGGFWIRFLAYLVDGIILFIALILLAVLAAFLGEIGAMLYGLLSFVGPFLYFAVLESSPRQATFGKQLVGLKVAHAATGERVSFLRALGRELAKILSSLILAIGFIMAAFTGRKQGLHDFIASTVVVRDRPGNVLVAVILVVAGVVLPFFVLPLIMGLLVGVLGLGMFGALMDDAMKQPKKEPAPKPSISQPATKQPEKPRPPVSASPAPAATPAAQALTEAEYDKFLAAPLQGIEKPSSARAGPALLQLDTFFGDSMWLKVMLPPIPNLDRSRASVTINRILDAKGEDRYDRDSPFEKEFFRNVNLGEIKTGVPHFSGNRTVRLKKGTTETDVQKVEGVLNLLFPIDLKVLTLTAADAGKEKEVGPLKVTLKSLQREEVSFTFTHAGAAENFLGTLGYDDKGVVVPSVSVSQSGGSQTIKFRAPVARIEVAAASILLKREYPFSVTRGATAPAATAATSSAAPAKPAAPEKPTAIAAAPAKPAAVEAKPAPAKPATPEKPAVAAAKPAAPAKTTAPKPAPVMRAEAAPKPAPAVAPLAEKKPKATRRTASRKPAAAEPQVAASVAPDVRTAKYNDVMTPVLYGDRAGAAEAIELGFWVDRPASNGMTALMAAAQSGDAAMTRLLLKNGADPNRRGAGGSVLDFARSGGNNAVVELLRQAGAR